jgi:hypothetical protein
LPDDSDWMDDPVEAWRVPQEKRGSKDCSSYSVLLMAEAMERTDLLVSKYLLQV